MTIGRSRLAAPGFLVVLLLLACAEHAVASLGVLWRATAVSWDSPGTQLHDEAASQGATHTDPSEQALGRLGIQASARLPLSSSRDVAGRLATESRLTRSPPVH